MVGLAHACSLPRSFHTLSLKLLLDGGHLASQEQAYSASSMIISLHPSSIPSTNSKDPYEVTPALQPSSDFEKRAPKHNPTQVQEVMLNMVFACLSTVDQFNCRKNMEKWK